MNRMSRMGMGMGAQQGGAGPRPDEKNATNTRDTRVRQTPGRGSAVFGGMVEGPNIKGDVAEAIKEEMATLEAEPADPLTANDFPTAAASTPSSISICCARESNDPLRAQQCAESISVLPQRHHHGRKPHQHQCCRFRHAGGGRTGRAGRPAEV